MSRQSFLKCVLPGLAAMAVLLPSLALLPGCRGGDESSGRPRVVATTSMVGDLVRRIGGEHVDLKVIMGPGVDPHTYKPSPDDIAELANAKRIFYNGLHLEGKMIDLFEKKLKDKSVALSSGVPIVPLAINGTSWLRFGGRIVVRVAEPIPASGRPTREAIAQLTQRTFEALHALVADQPELPRPGPVGRWLTELFNEWPDEERRPPAG